MINLFPANSRYHADHGWLKSNFSFSFAEYFDPANTSFSVMRVLNDDIIAPLRGFGTHPHREMEIVSIVLDGYLKHEDSSGHSATTTFGGVQRMTAGTGISHSEVNPSSSDNVNLLQMWFFPDTSGLKPEYEQTTFNVEQLKNNLLPVVSKKSTTENVATINQDLTIYLSDLEEGKSVSFTQEAGRKIFVFVIDGEITLNDEATLLNRDSARITELHTLNITASSSSRFMLIDLP